MLAVTNPRFRGDFFTVCPGPTDNSEFQAVHQFGFKADAATTLTQVATADQKNVLGAFAKRCNLGGVQMGAVLGQCICDGIEQPWPVSCD